MVSSAAGSRISALAGSHIQIEQILQHLDASVSAKEVQLAKAKNAPMR